ncbi:hypothetical protein [Pedobacter sp. NJ-S-72]
MALDRMAEFKLNHLPVLNNGQFLGIVAEEHLMEIRNVEEPIGALRFFNNSESVCLSGCTCL